MVGEVTGSLGNASSTANVASQKLSADYESFLKLLTAQLQNQDPLEPMDSSTFVSQLAQLSQVEQSVAVNDNLEGISSQLSSMSAIAGLNLIGRSVVPPTEQLALEAGGTAVASYRLAGEASNVSMSIVSADGTLLRSYDGLSGSAGELHNVTWDGMDYEGLPLPEGSYYMVVSAADAAGNSVPAQTYAASRVTGMTYENGLATLQMANGGTTLAGLIEEIR